MTGVQYCTSEQCEVCGGLAVVLLEIGPLDPGRGGSGRWCGRCYRELVGPAAAGRAASPARGPGVTPSSLALTVRQPWAWAIVAGHKPLENRTHPPERTGPIWIHAAKGCTRSEYTEARAAILEVVPGLEVPELATLPRGALVGAAFLGPVCTPGWIWSGRAPSPAWERRARSWYCEEAHGWALRAAVALAAPVACAGALGFWRPPPSVATAALKQLEPKRKTCSNDT